MSEYRPKNESSVPRRWAVMGVAGALAVGAFGAHKIDDYFDGSRPQASVSPSVLPTSPGSSSPTPEGTPTVHKEFEPIGLEWHKPDADQDSQLITPLVTNRKLMDQHTAEITPAPGYVTTIEVPTSKVKESLQLGLGVTPKDGKGEMKIAWLIQGAQLYQEGSFTFIRWVAKSAGVPYKVTVLSRQDDGRVKLVDPIRGPRENLREITLRGETVYS